MMNGTIEFKGIVNFEINFWYVLVYLKGIQDVGVLVFTTFSILTFFGQTVVVCQSYAGGEGLIFRPSPQDFFSSAFFFLFI